MRGLTTATLYYRVAALHIGSLVGCHATRCYGSYSHGPTGDFFLGPSLSPPYGVATHFAKVLLPALTPCGRLFKLLKEPSVGYYAGQSLPALPSVVVYR